MNIIKDDIEVFIKNYNDQLIDENIIHELSGIYAIDNNNQKYVLETLVKNCIRELKQKEEEIKKRRNQLNQLKQLKLPDQRTKEWYEMRKNKLTASALGSAIGHCHFQSRDELILSKIEEKPFEPNPITEWGVKYEEVAIMFYEELYKVKVLDFGLIPHPEFEAFGASPDGICDDTGNDEYLGRMVEIKCPPKRKFTKTVPPHYLMQVKGQLEVCKLDECDFFQVKILEYENFDEYCKDTFVNDDHQVEGRTSQNFPKGVVITYKQDEKLSYKYAVLNQTNKQLQDWIEQQSKGDLFEVKWWKIESFQCTLVTRDDKWWMDTIGPILNFYSDLIHYKENPDELEKLKKRIEESKKRKKKVELKPMNEFQLISDEEDN